MIKSQSNIVSRSKTSDLFKTPDITSDAIMTSVPETTSLEGLDMTVRSKKVRRSSPILWHNRPQTTHVSCLYPELLTMIFQNLDVTEKGRVAQVCKTWRNSAYNKSVWRGIQAKLHLKRPSNCREPNIFPSLVKRGIKRVQILSIQKDSRKEEQQRKRKTNFDRFDEEGHLKEVTQNMPNIDSIVLSGCFSLTDDKLIPAFTSQVTSLTELNLSMCKKITDQSIVKISKSAINLQILDLGGCASISNKSLEFIHSNLHLLKHLNLRSCRNITDSGIAKLCGQVPSSLDIEGYPSQQAVNDNEDSGFPSLEFLGLQDCQKLTDDALKYVSLGLRRLKSINLSFCASFTEFGLKSLSTMATSLKEVNLRSCDNISDSALKYLSEGGVALHVLDVSFCDKVTDQGLEFISQGLPQIQALSLNSCGVSDVGILKLSQTLTELKTLNIGQCSRVTDKALNAIINNCPHLSSLDIYGCPSISSSVIERLVARNVSLSRDLWPDTSISPEEQPQTPQTVLSEIPTSTSNNNHHHHHPCNMSSSTTTNMSSTMNAMSHQSLEQFWLHFNTHAFGMQLMGSHV